jgi:hypothetical protein
MKGVLRRHHPCGGAEGTPCRHLALRVIGQAFRDLASPGGSTADQESAREFLAGSSMLHHWCQVADLDPLWMVARAKTMLASNGSRWRSALQPPGEWH